MKAATINSYKSTYRIQNVETELLPKLQSNELRIRMLYSSYNPIDWKARSGYFQKLFSVHQFKPSKVERKTSTSSSQKSNNYMILGSDFCGEITEIGSNVLGFKLGDLVAGAHKYGKNHIGTFAEQVIVRSDEAARVPEGMDPAFAATVGVAGMTAFQCLEKICPEGKRDTLRGKSLIIIGASGGVGSFASLLAKNYFGAYVYGVCSGANAEYLTGELGVDEVIDYRMHSLEDYIKRKPKSERERICAVIDCVGDKNYRSQSLKILGRNSHKRYVTPVIPESEHGISWGRTVGFAANALVKNTLSLIKSSCAVNVVILSRDPKKLEELLRFFNETGLYKKIPLKEYNLMDIQEADDFSETGKVRGKLVIRIGESQQAMTH